MRKLLPQHRNEFLPYPMLLIIPLILIPLRDTGIPPNRRNINHAIPKLDKRAPLDRDVQIRDVMQYELHQLLIPLLADPGDEAVRRERRPGFVRREPVLREAVVEERRDRDGRRAELFLLLYQVGAADEAGGAEGAELGEQGEHLWGYGLYVYTDGLET